LKIPPGDKTSCLRKVSWEREKSFLGERKKFPRRREKVPWGEGKKSLRRNIFLQRNYETGSK